jgi:hypothetical protein
LLLKENERKELIKENPDSDVFMKRFIGASEFLKGGIKYCLWITEEVKEKAMSIKYIKKRVNQVKEVREKSNREATRKLTNIPFSFGEIRHKDGDSIIVPRHSSETREYIPLGFLDSSSIIADSAMAVYDAEPWLFGVLHSKMHMVWVNTVGGKLKTDYRYSAKLCYNTFPFPEITSKQKETINQYVFQVLDERAKFPEKTMAWLYNPKTMPKGLRLAHKELDEAIERVYRLSPFNNDTERLEYLFQLYEEMTMRDTLFAKPKKVSTKKSKKSD